MNDENGLLRNSIRRKVIPVLERELGRGIRTSLARTGAIVGRDAYELSRQAEPYIADWLRDAARAGTARLPARKLSQLARPIAGRVAWAALVEVGGRSTDKDAEALLDLARGRAGRRVDLSAGLEAWRDREYVHVSLPPAENTRAEGAKR